jgi:Zn-dependent oligopeptidase
MENRAKEQESLQTFALHHKTKEPIPTAICTIIKDKALFGHGLFVAAQ